MLARCFEDIVSSPHLSLQTIARNKIIVALQLVIQKSGNICGIVGIIVIGTVYLVTYNRTMAS